MLTVGADETCQGQEATVLNIDLPYSSPSTLAANADISTDLRHPYFIQIVLVVSLVEDNVRNLRCLS